MGININRNFCKQCGICVHFCPRKVFSLNDELYPIVINWEACTKCLLCELWCPDFAIEVERDNEVSFR